MKLEGLLSFEGANAKVFSDKNLLPQMVAAEVKDRLKSGMWSAAWRSQLALERNPLQHVDAPWSTGGIRRFFRINVKNLHRVNVARDCCAYLENAVRVVDPPTSIPLDTFELKWGGYTLPMANVLPQQIRHFSGACVDHNAPQILIFTPVCSDFNLAPLINNEGRYELTYVVLSSNFPASRITCTLNLGSDLNSVTLLPAAPSNVGNSSQINASCQLKI